MSPATPITFFRPEDDQPVWLPTDRFCVRKCSAVFAADRYWIYADVVPWDNPFWPNTYDTSVHAFSSAEGGQFIYQGKILPKGQLGGWDAGGSGTPGAVAIGDKVYLFYSGRENPDGTGRRAIGLAVADDPAGPFRKLPAPILTSAGHLDDPCPVLTADGEGIELYFREAIHDRPPPNYSIRLSRSLDGGATWSRPRDVLCAEGRVRAYETVEAKRLQSGHVWLAVFEHIAQGGSKTGCWVSEDGIHFDPRNRHYLEDHACRRSPVTVCGLQPWLIGNAEGVYDRIGIAQPVDRQGHYNQAIYHIVPLR